MFAREHDQPEQIQPRRAGWWRIAFVVFLVTVLALYLALPWLSSTAEVRRTAERELSARSGFAVVIGGLRLGYDMAVDLSQVSVGEFDADPFLTVEHAVVRLSPSGLFSDQPVAVELVSPRIHVDRLPEAKPGGEAASASIPVRTLDIAGGYVIADAADDPIGPIDLTVDELRAGVQEVQLSLSIGPEMPEVTVTASIGTRDGEFEFPTKLMWSGVPLGAVAERFGFGSGDSYEGILEASADVAGSLRDLRGVGSLQVRDFSYRGDGGEISGVVEASAEVTGSLRDLRGMGSLQVRDLRYRGDGGAISGVVEASLDFAGPLADLGVGGGSLQVRDLDYRGDGVQAAGVVDATFALDGERIVVDEPGLRFGDVTWTAGGLSGSTPAATFVGAIAFDGSGVRTVGNLSMKSLQASDEKSERVVAGLALTGELDGLWHATGPPVVRLSVSATAGEVLWDRFYADVALHQTTAASTIAFDDKQRIVLSDIDARVAGVGAFTGRARLTPTGSVDSADLRIEVTDLAELYAVGIRDPFQESHPFLAEMKVEGILNADVAYEGGPSPFRLSGQLRLRDASLSANDPDFAFENLRLDLPLRLGPEATGGDAAGQLRIGSTRFGEVLVEGVEAPLVVRTNRVALAAPLDVRLLGGSLRIGQFHVEEILAARPRASLALTVADIDVAALATATGLPPLRGSISGAIAKITAVGSEVRSEGEIRIQAFDGNFIVRDLSIDRAFSPLPAFGLNLDFDDISLGRVTETLEIGRISGVARGAAHDLVIVNGQPLSFDAWMETVDRSGVSQRVSVSAIRQLSILGGSGGDPISQGILGLFDEYRYSKMGFKCRLENDRFELHGVETIDGKEYLVVGSRLPPSVNVISHTQVISFPDMVRRLQRVTTAAAREDEKGE